MYVFYKFENIFSYNFCGTVRCFVIPTGAFSLIIVWRRRKKTSFVLRSARLNSRTNFVCLWLVYLDEKLDHAALAVGFGKEKGEEFWIIKNSWSISWGDKGFIKISAKDDNCGVTQKAVVVKVRSNSDLR